MSDLLNENEVAKVLRVKPSTLQSWRHLKTGPIFLKIGRLARYRLDDVEAWADAQRREPGRG